MTSNIIRLKTVQMKTGLSRSSIYALMEAKEFPRQIRIGIRAVGWLEQEIDIWVSKRIGARHDS